MLVIVVLILLPFIWMGNAPTRRMNREFRETMDDMKRRSAERARQMATQKDEYYIPLRGRSGGLRNQDFYGDGSLKRDPFLGKSYGRGQYYCDSRGYMANYSNAPKNMERPS
jgi:hypothetical protein